MICCDFDSRRLLLSDIQNRRLAPSFDQKCRSVLFFYTLHFVIVCALFSLLKLSASISSIIEIVVLITGPV